MAVADQIAAQAAKDALAKELQGKFNYVDTAYTQAQEAAKANTQNILNQLTQKATDYQTQFGEDSRSAYINKMQSNQKLEGELARLGLGNSGYGVTQRLQSETAYGKNLTELQKALSQNLTAIDQSKATANTELGNTLASLAQNFASQKTSIDQYIINQLQNAYDTAYNRSYQERMDAEKLAASYASSGGGYYSGSSGSSKTKSGNTKTKNTTTTSSSKKTSMYVPSTSVKNFINKTKILKTKDQKQNMLALALSKGDISQNDVAYVSKQLGLN